MAKLKLSNIVERELYIDSDSFKSLSPKVRAAVKDIYERIQKETGDIIKVFEGTVDKAAEFHNINTNILYDYFDKELEEQLGE